MQIQGKKTGNDIKILYFVYTIIHGQDSFLSITVHYLRSPNSNVELGFNNSLTLLSPTSTIFC